MVICTYFLNNTCRFGTKCHNEHVNVKLTLKTDAESTIKGNQWPLSCYGPFRDKPCIPNFIEDQSFEEVRHRCYEAKATGNVQMVTNQFTQNALDARNKMNMLLNPSDEVVTLVTNLYNSNCNSTPVQNQTTPANPFGMASSNTMNAGILNKPLFGGSSVSNSNPFARNTSAFGGAQNQTTNLFGGSSTNTNSMNLFGGTSTNNATSGGSLFGGSSFSNTNNTSAFGGGQTQSSTSLFGGAFSQQTTNASPFASQSTGLFGAQVQLNPVFGGGATFGSQVKPGLFGQAAQQASNGNIFGQSATPAFGAQTQTNLFSGNATQTQTSSIFGGATQQQTMQKPDNPFAAVAQSATTNIFGQSQMQQQQQQQQQQQSSPFQSTTNAFGANANTQNSFGQHANVGMFASINQINTNQMNTIANAVHASAAPQQQQSSFGTSSFGSQPATTPNQIQFGGNANLFQNAQGKQPLFEAPAQQPVQISKKLYTPMDALSPDEIAAFNSTTFDITKIPTKPPPIELCF